MSNFLLGERGLFQAEIRRKSDNALVDPAVLRVKVRTPQLGITTYTHGIGPTVVKTAVGKYEIEVLLNKPGEWLIRFEGNSSNETAVERPVLVHESAFYNASGAELPDS